MNVSEKRGNIRENVVALPTPETSAVVEFVRRHVHRYRKLESTLLLLVQLCLLRSPRSVRNWRRRSGDGLHHLLQIPHDVVSTERRSGVDFRDSRRGMECGRFQRLQFRNRRTFSHGCHWLRGFRDGSLTEIIGDWLRIIRWCVSFRFLLHIGRCCCLRQGTSGVVLRRFGFLLSFCFLLLSIPVEAIASSAPSRRAAATAAVATAAMATVVTTTIRTSASAATAAARA